MGWLLYVVVNVCGGCVGVFCGVGIVWGGYYVGWVLDGIGSVWGG